MPETAQTTAFALIGELRSHLDLEQATIRACGRTQAVATPRPSGLRRNLTRGEPRGGPRRHRSATPRSTLAQITKNGDPRSHKLISSPNSLQPLAHGKFLTGPGPHPRAAPGALPLPSPHSRSAARHPHAAAKAGGTRRRNRRARSPGQQAEHPRGGAQPARTARANPPPPQRPGLPSPRAAQAPSAPPETRQGLTHPPPPALAGPAGPRFPLSAAHPLPSALPPTFSPEIPARVPPGRSAPLSRALGQGAPAPSSLRALPSPRPQQLPWRPRPPRRLPADPRPAAALSRAHHSRPGPVRPCSSSLRSSARSLPAPFWLRHTRFAHGPTRSAPGSPRPSLLLCARLAGARPSANGRKVLSRLANRIADRDTQSRTSRKEPGPPPGPPLAGLGRGLLRAAAAPVPEPPWDTRAAPSPPPGWPLRQSKPRCSPQCVGSDRRAGGSGRFAALKPRADPRGTARPAPG
ncbi:basic proline-rich protein-like [Calypte anna]|uniref:basic proline-rich protein-like n=1 Tax=Calypte anna TaxID=9244 RepID=UPI0011C36A1F|nr:basic proline-rich protein-like [Calypte anna]